jgi:hypothetical protein
VVLYWAGSALAQDALLQRGTRELALSGAFDVQQEGDPVIDLTGRYGVFVRDFLEVGGFAEIAGDFDEAWRYGLGGFAEYHLPHWAFLKAPYTLPYVGADLGLAFVDTDLGEDNAALIFRPRVGLKWYLRDYFAIDTSFFVALATDDLFLNEEDDLDPYDIGFRLGIRVYFR